MLTNCMQYASAILERAHMITKIEISNAASSLARSIRDWSIEQAHLWRQLPNLALEAADFSDLDDNLSACYDYGYWRISTADQTLSVDCANGQFISEPDATLRGPSMDASDTPVLWLATHLDHANASDIIRRLKERKKYTRLAWRSEAEWAEAEASRSEARIRLSLGYDKLYRRLADAYDAVNGDNAWQDINFQVIALPEGMGWNDQPLAKAGGYTAFRFR
jgi:hypothetical protein